MQRAVEFVDLSGDSPEIEMTAVCLGVGKGAQRAAPSQMQMQVPIANASRNPSSQSSRSSGVRGSSTLSTASSASTLEQESPQRASSTISVQSSASGSSAGAVRNFPRGAENKAPSASSGSSTQQSGASSVSSVPGLSSSSQGFHGAQSNFLNSATPFAPPGEMSIHDPNLLATQPPGGQSQRHKPTAATGQLTLSKIADMNRCPIGVRTVTAV